MDAALLQEVEQQIRELSVADLLRLERYARYQVFRYPSINPKEILGEAVARVLNGDRTWRRDVPMKTFLCNVMRSIADEFRDRARNDGGGTAAGGSGEEDVSVQDGDDPESRAADRAFLASIWDLFADDEDVRVLIKGMEEDLTAKELQKKYGLSEARYGAARKRFERTLAKRYPHGLKS